MSRRAANGSKVPRSTANGPTLDVSNARANCRSGKARLAAKVRDQGRAALGRYPPIGDRLGQCLVSDGFETRIGRADKAKSIQTKNSRFTLRVKLRNQCPPRECLFAGVLPTYRRPPLPSYAQVTYSLKFWKINFNQPLNPLHKFVHTALAHPLTARPALRPNSPAPPCPG